MKLIDKAAVVAEIAKLKLKYECCDYECGWNRAINRVLEHIDDLELKDLDLYHELDKYFEQFKGLEKNNWNWRVDSVNIHSQGIYDFAKYFFELGLKQSSDEVKIGESQIYLNDDGGEPPYDGKQWLDLSCTEYEIPSDKFQDGDKIEIVIRKIKKGETK